MTIQHDNERFFRNQQQEKFSLLDNHILQTLEVEFTDVNENEYCDLFEISNPKDHLDSIMQKMAFIVECHLTDNEADFAKPITLRYIPDKQTT